MERNNKKFWIMLVILGLWILFLCTMFVRANAEELSQPTDEMIKGFATAYNGPTDYTCTGDEVREGICGGCRDYLGKTIILYQRLPDNSVGDMIGIYECLDTGTGTQGFQEGRVIDVWKSDKEAIQEFADLIYSNGCQGKVWIQVIDAEG